MADFRGGHVVQEIPGVELREWDECYQRQQK
jgi:hypothetical protein